MNIHYMTYIPMSFLIIITIDPCPGVEKTFYPNIISPSDEGHVNYIFLSLNIKMLHTKFGKGPRPCDKFDNSYLTIC